MSYRHAFHAGNFADVLKHAVLLRVLRRMAAAKSHVKAIDTHAGSGLYELLGPAASATRESDAGVGRLMSDRELPTMLRALADEIMQLNPVAGLAHYPGSAVLIARALRPGDRLVAFEIREDDAAELKAALAPYPGATAIVGEGWKGAVGEMASNGRLLIHIDPPFETGDDIVRAARLVGTALRRASATVVILWLPIKDLATLDFAYRTVAQAGPGTRILAIEARLRPLADPLRLNGCALVVVNPPASLDAEALPAATWCARASGEAGAVGRVFRLD